MQPDFTYLNDAIPDAILDIRYASEYNFTGHRVDGYLASRPSLATPAALALAKVADDLRPHGYRLLIYDAYRPQRAVNFFLQWCAAPDDPGNADFFIDVTKAQLFTEGFLSAHSAHSRGSAVDLTLVHADGSPVDMGGSFDLFARSSYADFPDITPAQRQNRDLLRSAMLARGFRGCTTEWWHFRLIDEPYPDTYFDFEVR